MSRTKLAGLHGFHFTILTSPLKHADNTFVNHRLHPTIAAASLLSIAVVLSLGSMGDASVAAAIVSSRALTVHVTEGESSCRASWFGALSDTAKRMHAQQRCGAAIALKTLDTVHITDGLIVSDAVPPGTPAARLLTSHRLIDLPPPTA